MPTEANFPPSELGANVLGRFSMAGFEVIIYGRFWVIAEGTGSISAKIYSKRICPSLSPMFSVRLDVKRQSSKGGITAFVTV
jgi:hypothetical protein